MNKKIFVFIIFIIVLIAGMVFLYVYFELGKQKIFLTNLTISAKENGKFIKTGYKIFNKNVFYKQGITLEEGILLDSVPSNSTIIIFNYNLENQTYYSDKHIINTSLYNIYRVNFNLIKPQEVFFNYSGKLDKENITLEIWSEYFKNPILCLRWFTHIIFINTNLSFTNKPKEYANYDKCYELGESLKENKKEYINLNYKTFGVLDKTDYIKIVIIDRETINNKNVTFLNGKDIGGLNKEYLIPYINNI